MKNDQITQILKCTTSVLVYNTSTGWKRHVYSSVGINVALILVYTLYKIICIIAQSLHDLYRKLPKILPSCTFRQKWGGGVCSNDRLVHTPPPFVLCSLEYAREFDNHDDCSGFLKERHLRWTCTTGNQPCLH